MTGDRANFEWKDVRYCEWRFDDAHYKWDTTCDNGFQFTYDGPKENGFNFCPFCGGVIALPAPGDT